MADPKRPYGGLIPSQPKGTRAYHDAAAYNQHLAQHQAYTQAQAATQAAQNAYRNPYLAPQTQQQQQSQPTQPPLPQIQQPPQQSSSSAYAVQTNNASNAPPPTYSASQRALNHQASHGHLSVSGGSSQYGQSHGFPVTTHLTPTAPPSTYQATTTTRTRSNTMHQMMDNVPPALARLQHMNQDVIGGRKALTPVLKRDDPLREWERRQSGKAATAQPYPQLEYLEQQAQLAATQGMGNWGYSGTAPRFHQAPSSNLAHSSYTNPMVVDDDRREVAMSNVRAAARGEATGVYGNNSNVMPNPPQQAYTSPSTTAGNRYPAAYPQQQNAAASPLDSLDRRTDIGNMYVPMQPDQYGYNAGSSQSLQSRQIGPPVPAVPASFYGAGVVPTGAASSSQQRNPFSPADALPTTQGQQPLSNERRKSGMDVWSQ